MAIGSFVEALSKLGFDSKFVSSSLFFTSKNYSSDELFFEERLVLDSAEKLQASAVYFRRFPDKQSSQPQLFLFDNTNNAFSDDDLANIHRKIWSGGIVPIYYVFDKTNINIFDARKRVDYDVVTKNISVSPFETLSLVSASYQEYQNYSAKLFVNGSFWEQKIVKNRFLSKESAENKLIEGLKRVRSHFINESGLDKSTAQQLLVLSILVKYLEERVDNQGKHVFPNNYFNDYDSSSSFCEVLRKGYVVELFEDLSTHFNGKIFELEEEEKKTLKKTDLNTLAHYLDANADGNQLVLWPLYSFEYLPVELISRIYEEFIDQRQDAVFTPIHLARFMVDECMPISEPRVDYKIIDVSCGSGVFLVTVFKRLVQWWQKRKFDETGTLTFPESDDLKSILLNSVHGVDIEEDSVRLSVFSLSIALCDMLTPTKIWTDLRFDDLREQNIYEGDFFKFLSNTKNDRFDLVIGNPPFSHNVKDFNKLILEYDIKMDYHIPNNQIAMLFLQQAMKLLRPKGLLSFVMPSGPLLYNNTIDFRKNFFSRYEVPQIFDLSLLRDAGALFEKTVSTAVVFAYNKAPVSSHSILHVGVKKNKVSKEKLFFEVDAYDMNFVSQEIASESLIVWKSNLIGGNGLFFLIDRLKGLRNLGEYLKEKKIRNGWEVGEGYNYGNRSKTAPHLTGKKLVESSMFSEDGILATKIEDELYFEGTRAKRKKIFEAPHLLIKELLGQKKFITQYLEEDLIFKHRIIGIHAPWKEKDNLKKLHDFLQKNYSLFKLFILATSSETVIGRSGGYVVSKRDFMNLPYPENGGDLSLSASEKIIREDILKYKLEELSKGEKAKMNVQAADEKELQDFGKVFCENLNPIYENENSSFKPLTPIETLSYICFPFAYGKDDFSPEISSKEKEGDLSELIENQQESVLYRRVLRLYQKDLVFLIKPKTLRYWLKSIALRDASDVMIDLANSGY